MNEKKKQDSGQLKKPYSKPELSKVPLRPEEAVLAFCKIKQSTGPSKANCGIGQPCSAQGS
jgi:hypothetical protein